MGTMKDILTFRRMIIPWAVQGIFWLLLIFYSVMAVRYIVTGHILQGVLFFVAGVLISRIFLELVIVTFRSYEALVSINHALTSKKAGTDIDKRLT